MLAGKKLQTRQRLGAYPETPSQTSPVHDNFQLYTVHANDC